MSFFVFFLFLRSVDGRFGRGLGGKEEAVLQRMKKKEPPNEFAYERHVNILYLHVFFVFFISLCA